MSPLDSQYSFELHRKFIVKLVQQDRKLYLSHNPLQLHVVPLGTWLFAG